MLPVKCCQILKGFKPFYKLEMLSLKSVNMLSITYTLLQFIFEDLDYQSIRCFFFVYLL
jgi:hypothetical protein